MCHFPSKKLYGDGDLLFEWYKSRNVIVRVTSTTKVDVDHGIVQLKNTPLKIIINKIQKLNIKRQTNKKNQKNPKKIPKKMIKNETCNWSFVKESILCAQRHVTHNSLLSLQDCSYMYRERKRDLYEYKGSYSLLFKWMSSIWITCMIYGLFLDIDTIDTLNYEYHLGLL